MSFANTTASIFARLISNHFTIGHHSAPMSLVEVEAGEMYPRYY